MEYVVSDSLVFSEIPEGYSICKFTKFKRFKCGDYMVIVDPIIKKSYYNIPSTGWYSENGRQEVSEIPKEKREEFIDKMRRTYLKLGALL